MRLLDVYVVVWFACVVACVACSSFLTPAESADVEGTAAIVARCEAQGFACEADAGNVDGGLRTGCYAVYDACMRDAGLLP